MLRIRDPAELAAAEDPYVRDLIAGRLAEMTDGAPYDPDVHGFFVVMTAGDPLAEVEAAVERPLLINPITARAFGEPGFDPVFEFVGRHPGWFEVVLVPDSGDFGIVLLIPDTPDIDQRLRALCATAADQFATDG